MGIRSLSFVLAIVTLVLFASAPPKPINAQVPTVVLATHEFGIVPTNPNPRYREMKYCAAKETYFIFEPTTQYSPNNEYVLFYYLDDHKTIAHDEASLDKLTVVIDDSVSAPIARLVGTERGEKVWNIVVTAKMKEAYNDCLGKLKTQ